MKGLLRRQKSCLLTMTGKRVSLRRSGFVSCNSKLRAEGAAGCNLILSKGREYHFELSPKAPKTHILSLRASVFVLCERGNLSFNVLGGVLRRVFQFEWVKIPPSILPPKDKKEKYSNARSFAKSAQDDKVKMSLRGRAFVVYGRGNLGFSSFQIKY